MQRKQFTFYRSYYEAVKELPKKEQCAVMLAICAYALDSIEPDLEQMSDATAIAFGSQLELLDREKREAKEGRRNSRYKQWRRDVFERDDYTCQKCGKRGVKLNAHHKKPYAFYHSLRYELDNGITLCISCHKDEHRRRE